MAEIRFQNPTTPTAQLESEVVNYVKDFADPAYGAEIRREYVANPGLEQLLTQILLELRRIRMYEMLVCNAMTGSGATEVVII